MIFFKPSTGINNDLLSMRLVHGFSNCISCLTSIVIVFCNRPKTAILTVSVPSYASVQAYFRTTPKGAVGSKITESANSTPRQACYPGRCKIKSRRRWLVPTVPPTPWRRLRLQCDLTVPLLTTDSPFAMGMPDCGFHTLLAPCRPPLATSLAVVV